MAAAASMLAAVLLCKVVAAAAFFSVADCKTPSAADGNLVAKTCADMMSHDWGMSFDDEKFCESRLRLDKKRSAAAKHPRDLALISMDLAQRAVADVNAKLDAVLRSGAGHRTNDTELILQHCRLDYAAVASTIPVCRAMVKVNDYNKQRLVPSDYLECARRLRIDATRCWFRVGVEDDLSKLVLKEIEEAWMRIELVDGMLEEMLGVVINDHKPPL